MALTARPHVLGIDEGPFDKFESPSVPLVAVMMEGPDRVEAVAIRRFPVDGEDVAAFLADWIGGLRCRPALHGVLFSGITLAGLAILDVEELARRTGLPVVVVNRRPPVDARLIGALETAGLSHRKAILARAPVSRRLDAGLYAAWAGADRETAADLVERTLAKSALPEPLRLAHLIARAIATGESRGRP
jgi:endonuclease V-like protein UPF0215 family